MDRVDRVCEMQKSRHDTGGQQTFPRSNRDISQQGWKTTIMPASRANPDQYLSSVFSIANAIANSFAPGNAICTGGGSHALAQCLRARGVQVFDGDEILDGRSDHMESYELLITVPHVEGPQNSYGRITGPDRVTGIDANRTTVHNSRAAPQGDLPARIGHLLNVAGMPSTASLLCIPPASDQGASMAQASRQPGYKELKDVFIDHGMYPVVHSILEERSDWRAFAYLNPADVDTYIAHLEKKLEETRLLRHQVDNELAFSTEAFARAQKSRSWIIAEKLSSIRYHRHS
ncbi:MAG: hypothetical protein ACYDGY_10605 [Acidimicrobiales bacterium]